MTTIRDNVRAMTDEALDAFIKRLAIQIPHDQRVLAHMRRELKRRKRANRTTT